MNTATTAVPSCFDGYYILKCRNVPTNPAIACDDAVKNSGFIERKQTDIVEVHIYES